VGSRRPVIFKFLAQILVEVGDQTVTYDLTAGRRN
jgi:hypothetical protein